MYSKYQKIKSLLDNEDIYQIIIKYLQNIDYDVTVDKFKIYVE